MTTIILTIHVLIVLALIGIVLLQRSEGGALGMGGGGGAGGGFMTSRGAANALTRTTSVLAALFFATSISLAIFADRGESDTDVIRGLTGEEVTDPNQPITADDLTRTLGGDDDGEDPDSVDLLQSLGGDDAAEDAQSVEDALDALGSDDSDLQDPSAESDKGETDPSPDSDADPESRAS